MLNFAFPLSPRTHQPRMTGLASLKGYVQVEEEKKSFVKKKKKVICHSKGSHEVNVVYP